MTGAMLVPASASMASDPATAELDGSDTELSATVTSVNELRTLVDDLSIANEALEADNSSLQQSVESLSLERDRLQHSLTTFESLYDPLEADRKLLVELRKDLPDTRPEAEAQLQRLHDLALSSDPAKLGRLIDRVEDAAPAFLDWRFQQFTSAQEATQAYVNSGANAFDSSMTEFRSGVLLSVANRLDGLLTTLDRLR
jgi:chromosome segregation ATPase